MAILSFLHLTPRREAEEVDKNINEIYQTTVFVYFLQAIVLKFVFTIRTDWLAKAVLFRIITFFHIMSYLCHSDVHGKNSNNGIH